jgi:hypothetical protein
MYAFNITNAINTYSTFGHELAVDAFANSTCSPYATPQSIANSISSYKSSGGDLNSFNPQNPRTCYASLGPNQPGVTTTDPSNPSACVPDPGGYPVQGFGTQYTGPKTSACKLQANPLSTSSNGTSGTGILSLSKKQPSTSSAGSGGALSAGNAASSAGGAVNQAASNAASTATGAVNSATQSSQSGNSSSTAPTQALLNYLLSQ